MLKISIIFIFPLHEIRTTSASKKCGCGCGCHIRTYFLRMRMRISGTSLTTGFIDRLVPRSEFSKKSVFLIFGGGFERHLYFVFSFGGLLTWNKTYIIYIVAEGLPIAHNVKRPGYLVSVDQENSVFFFP